MDRAISIAIISSVVSESVTGRFFPFPEASMVPSPPDPGRLLLGTRTFSAYTANEPHPYDRTSPSTNPASIRAKPSLIRRPFYAWPRRANPQAKLLSRTSTSCDVYGVQVPGKTCPATGGVGRW